METKKRDEVIKMLRHCADHGTHCSDCAYNGGEGCVDMLLADAARLLENSVDKLVIKRKEI